MTEETKTEKDIQELIDLAFSAVVQTSVELEDDQLDALENLNQYCVNAALHNPEVIKKPLKVVYKTNEGLKEALVAICLAYSLINPRRKLRENKEFFDYPKINPKAKKYDKISITDVVDKHLGVIDMTASVMCMENRMPLMVFGLNEKDSIVNALSGKFNGTIVTVD